MYDNIHIRELIFDEICAVFIDSKESFSFSYRDLIDRKSSKYVALGFILGDSTIIPKNNYHYIEVKSTKLPTIIAAYIHLRNIIYDENYLYLNCSKSGHGVLDYHIRIKSKEPLLDYIRKVKKSNDMSALRCLLGNLGMRELIEFVTGYFDADGCVSFNTNTNSVKISFISKSKDLLIILSGILRSFGISLSQTPTIISSKTYRYDNIEIRKKRTFQIYTINKASTMKLIEYMTPFSQNPSRRLKLIIAYLVINKVINRHELRRILSCIRTWEDSTRAVKYMGCREKCKEDLSSLIKSLQ